ncbi:MAG TPA: PQQ-binding-like beta-propeller repeat protein [Candidatus Binatia bacterium]|nr:PQQ-binding-like beta-propeller repeat protein [Candidatus Binatia bacterium]
MNRGISARSARFASLARRRTAAAIVGAASALSLLLGVAGSASAQAKWTTYGIEKAYYGIAGDSKKVYVAGRSVSEVNGTFDVLVDAYDAATGAHVWRNEYDSGDDEAGGLWLAHQPKDASELRNDLVRVQGGRVFVGGLACAAPGCNAYGFFTESTLYAYDATSGAMLWKARNHVNGLADGGAMAIEVAPNRVFVGSYAQVYAYDAVSGQELWHTYLDNQVSGLEYRNGRLFVTFDDSNNAQHATIQALDPSTGASLWENDDVQPAGVRAPIWGMATDASRVYGVGYRTGDIYLLRAFDPVTGAVLWRSPAPGGWELATYGRGVSVATGLNRVFTAGYTAAPGSDETNFLVRAHSATTGALLWQDELDFGFASAAYEIIYVPAASRVALKPPIGRVVPQPGPRPNVVPGLVVAAGYGMDAFNDGIALLRAYDPATGALAWERDLSTAGRRDEFLAIQKVGKRIVATGTSTKELGMNEGQSLDQDGIIAAYE